MSTLKIGKNVLKPMNMLWPLYVCWAYASWSDAFTHQFINFSSVNSGYPQHMQTELMHMLSMRLRNWCIRWAYTSETHVCTEYMHQEQINALSIWIRNWVYNASRTYACSEHTHQELMRALSTHIRNLCMHWSYYTSETYACTEHTHQELMRALSIHIGYLPYLCMHWAYAQRTYMVVEHTRQFLTRMLSISVTIPNLKRSLLDMLSIRVRNSCWTYAYDQRAHKNLTYA